MYYNLNDNGGFLSPRSITESYNMMVAKENDELKKQLEEKEKIINANFEIINAVAMEEANKILNKVGEDNE